MLPPKTARALEAILARTVGVDESGIAVGVLKHDPKQGRLWWRGARGWSNRQGSKGHYWLEDRAAAECTRALAPCRIRYC